MTCQGIVRRLGPGDRQAFVEHLFRLDAADRACRFAARLSDAKLGAYGHSAIARRPVVLGYTVDGVVRGVGELCPIGATRGLAEVAEAAFSVERAYRRCGVGTALMRRLMLAARNRHIKQLYMLCLIDNVPVQNLARQFGARLRLSGGEVEAFVALPRPTLASLLLDIVEELEVLAALAAPAGRHGAAMA